MSRNGMLSRMHKKGRIRRGAVNRDPLRLVVEYVVLDGIHPREVLECGHKLTVRQDFIGDCPSTVGVSKRRCPYCARPAPGADKEG